MAGIDKTYTKSYDDYKKLVEWAKKTVFTCPNGVKLHAIDYIYYWSESDFNSEIPVLNTSNAFDYFLIKYCPFDFVQERMQYVYSKEFYDSVKNGTSEYDTFTKEGKYGKHCKIIKRPNYMTKTPLGQDKWFIQPIYEAGEDLWYDEDNDTWLWSYELGEATTNVCWKYKSLKSVIRHILKWKLPIGTILTLHSRYVGIDWIIKITK